MSIQSLPWFRMYTDFLNDPKMIALAFEDQRHFIGILALKSDGALDQDCCPDLMDRIVAQRLWIDHAIIREVKKRLIAAGLINEFWQPLAWNKRQMRSDADPTNAERQRRHRERQKAAKEAEEKAALEAKKKAQIQAQSEAEQEEKEEENESNALRNAPVTPTDIDTDIDKETDITTTLSSKPDSAPGDDKSDSTAQVCKRVIDHLNLKTGSAFRHADSHMRLIASRLKAGATEDELCRVIDRKCLEWLQNPEMRQYLRPGTLFSPKNYDNYVGQLTQPLPNKNLGNSQSSGKFDPTEYINRNRISRQQAQQGATDASFIDI